MNKYDQVELDINQLLAEQRRRSKPWQPHSNSAEGLSLISQLRSWLALYSTGILYKMGVLRRLIYANLKLGWFFEFREYWVKELGLRRIEPHDFYYLLSLYRQKFQNLEVVNENDSKHFLKAWQDPASIYLLFHYQYKLALEPLSAYLIAPYISKGANVCEFGCGLAPITQGLINYYPHLAFNITAADIPSYMLHFVGWKFRRQPFVRVLLINPADNTPLDSTYDVITCMTVLEHLPRPLAIVSHLHERLKPGGHFMFDYIKSEGTGLDTVSALQEREAVLRFIRKHFVIVRGSIPPNAGDIQTVICRKK